ncbi:MAG TPA: hypothetical protein VFV62_09325, partial [Gaiellaceae bacterium]|nr:hypothetical protein [Gaiellaceae bacterium]
MTGRRLAIGGVLLALVVAAAAFALLRDSGADDAALRALRARATLSDRIVVFGDTVTARVEIVFDRRQIDPAAI